MLDSYTIICTGQVPWNKLPPEEIKRQMLVYHKTLRLDKSLERTLHGLLSVGLKACETVRSTISVDEIRGTLRTVYEVGYVTCFINIHKLIVPYWLLNLCSLIGYTVRSK